MVFIGEESYKRRVNAYVPKCISMANYIMFLWIPGRDGKRRKVTGNFLTNALHRFNRRYHVKILSTSRAGGILSRESRFQAPKEPQS